MYGPDISFFTMTEADRLPPSTSEMNNENVKVFFVFSSSPKKYNSSHNKIKVAMCKKKSVYYMTQEINIFRFNYLCVRVCTLNKLL